MDEKACNSHELEKKNYFWQKWALHNLHRNKTEYHKQITYIYNECTITLYFRKIVMCKLN